MDNASAVSAKSEDGSSSLFALISEFKTDSEIKVRTGGKAVPYLTFRAYRTISEIDATKAQATLFADKFPEWVKRIPELGKYRHLDRPTIETCWLMGHLCVESDFDMLAFMRLADEVPLAFLNLRTAVDEAYFGNEAAIYNEGIESAKKD